jgi:hypothetical protein
MDKLMSNNKQSSVEWLAEQLRPAVALQGKIIDEYLKQAKEMHKEEIVNTYKGAQVLLALNDTKRAEQFYNEHYEQ